MAIPEVASALKSLAMARNRFLYGIEKVPDDRLEWSPGGSAKSALGLAGKLAGFLGFIAYMTEHSAMPDRTGPQPLPPATREEARAALEGAFDGLTGVLSALTPADLERTVPTPWGANVPIPDWMHVGNSVIAYHQGQLNYLQLCYGDEDPNMPPDWGKEQA